MTTLSSSTLDASSGMVSGKTKSFGDDTHDGSSSLCFVTSETEVLCGESTLWGVVSDGFPVIYICFQTWLN